MNDTTLEGLVLSTDREVINVFSRALTVIGLRVEVHPDPDAAVSALSQKKFDTVIVDCATGAKSTEILKSVRWLPSNNRAVVVAVATGGTSMREAFAGQRAIRRFLDNPRCVRKMCARIPHAGEGVRQLRSSLIP